MNTWISARIAMAALFVVAPGHAAPGWRYAVTSVTLTDLGTFGGSSSMAWDINDGGYIVGWATDAAGEKRAFYYLSNASYMYDIGMHTGIGRSEARGINNSKEVVGFEESPLGLTHAFYWFAGGHVMLNDTSTYPTDGRLNSKALAISDNGHIIGHRIYRDFGSYHEATLWSDHLTHHRLYPERYLRSSFAYDVNASGQAVGYEKDWDQAHRWQLSAGVVVDTKVPAAPNAYSADALGINGNGIIVGYNWVNGIRHAVMWDGSSASSVDLGVMGPGEYTVAEDVNNGNFVAAYGSTTWRSPPFFEITSDSALLYHWHFGFYALPKPTGLGINCRAHALNERQSATGLIQVVGYCTDNAGSARAVRWDVTVTAVRLFGTMP